MADSDEKTEDPTPKRRREAREKGQVLKSKEVNTAVLLLGVTYMLMWTGKGMYINLFKFFEQTFEEIPLMPVTQYVAMKLLARALAVSLLTVAPIFLTAYILMLTSEVLQVGFLFTTKTLQADLNRLNPIQGFKKIFSKKSVVEVLKSLAKVTVVGYFAYAVLRDNIPTVLSTIKDPPEAAFYITGILVIEIAKKVAMAMVCIAGLDYIYQRYEFEKSLKMSKQEVKDEYKQTEGDPHIKGKQKQKMRQMAMGQVQQAVPESTAVVTNPTHYAIAVKYEFGMKAPLVKAKGEGIQAILIKKIATDLDIPMFEDMALAQAMYPLVEVDKEIPAEFYVAVAQIIAQVFRTRVKKKGGGTARGQPGKTPAQLPLYASPAGQTPYIPPPPPTALPPR